MYLADNFCPFTAKNNMNSILCTYSAVNIFNITGKKCVIIITKHLQFANILDKLIQAKRKLKFLFTNFSSLAEL